jgi:hypothetical protein
VEALLPMAQCAARKKRGGVGAAIRGWPYETLAGIELQIVRSLFIVTPLTGPVLLLFS